MIYEDPVMVIVKEKKSDGLGGYTTSEREVGNIYCKVAPYLAEERDVVGTLNPWASVSFYTEDELPEEAEEDEEFFLRYNGKLYRKKALINYGKCIKIIGDRYHL